MFGVSEKIYNFVLYIKNKLMRKRQPKQDPSYMLFIFGDFDEQENLATNYSKLVGGEGFEPPVLPLGNRFTVCRRTTVSAAHLNSLRCGIEPLLAF